MVQKKLDLVKKYAYLLLAVSSMRKLILLFYKATATSQLASLSLAFSKGNKVHILAPLKLYE